MRRALSLILVGLVVPLAWAGGPSGPLPYVQGRRWAIVVGAEGYEHYSRLNYACDDARAVAKTLVDDFRFDPATVRVLTDDGQPTETPTAGHILGELETLLADKRLDRGDLFVFFFAGHGVGTPDGDYLLPTDARPASIKAVGVPVATLVQRFVERGLKNVLIVADACRNGRENPFGAELERLGRESNLAVMLGTAPGKRSYEDDRLKHGVFAHHLLQALADPKLRHPVSGALWASTVGKTVREATLAYTERDYGEDAQSPAVWASATEDVLLGAYVPNSPAEDVLAAFREQADALDPGAFVASMTDYAAQLLDAGRPADAVEILRAAEPIGLSPLGTYLLGLCFYLTERQAEATRRFRAVREVEPDSYFGSLAASFDPDIAFDPKERLAAAKRVFELGGDEVSAFVAWSVVKQHGLSEDQATLLKRVLAHSALGPHFKDYFEGELAQLEGRYDDALAAFGRVAQRADAREEEPSAYLGAMLKALLLDNLGRGDERIALVDQQIALEDAHQAVWLIERARRRRGEGDRAGALADVRAALGKRPEPDDLLNALRLLGTDAHYVAELAAEVSRRTPYSWRARLAASLADAMKGGAETLLAAFLEAQEYAPDQVGLRVEFVELFDAFLGDGFAQGVVPAEAYAQFAEGAFLMLDEVRASFPLGPYAWWPYVRMGCTMERQVQVARAATARFDKMLADGSVPPGMLDTLAIALTGTGDSAQVERVEKLALAAGPMARDAVRHLAFFHASQRRAAKARELLATLPPYPGKEGLGDSVLRAYLDALDAKSEAAVKALATLEPVEGYARALKGLALWEAGKQDDARALLEESRTDRSWGYPFVHLEAVRVLAEDARRRGDIALVDTLAYEASITQPGNPIIDAFTFEGAGDGTFEGSVQLTVTTRDDELEVSTGNLTLSVDARGQLRGVFEDAQGKIRALSGTVDSRGNVHGTVRGEGATLELLGKIPPLGRLAEIEPLATKGLLLIALDEQGRRTVWIGRPAPPPGPHSTGVTVMPLTLPSAISKPRLSAGQ